MEKHFSYELGSALGSDTAFGLIVLQSDETIEHDMRRLLPRKNVALYTSRVPSGAEVTTVTLGEMSGALTGAASLFPAPLSFDVVGYGCTSATSVIGADKVTELISKGCDTSHVTEPISALLAACRVLNVRKIGFLSPYIEDVSATLRSVLNGNGLEVVTFGSFNEARESNVARITPNSIRQAALDLVKDSEAEVLFLSCTNLQTLDIIQDLEDATGIPALSSNLVLGWHMLKLAGQNFEDPNMGRLMKLECRQT